MNDGLCFFWASAASRSSAGSQTVAERIDQLLGPSLLPLAVVAVAAPGAELVDNNSPHHASSSATRSSSTDLPLESLHSAVIGIGIEDIDEKGSLMPAGSGSPASRPRPISGGTPAARYSMSAVGPTSEGKVLNEDGGCGALAAAGPDAANSFDVVVELGGPLIC